MEKMEDLEQVTITKLVHGGQGLGTLADGRKVFVWNALPGEVVRVEVIKKKRSYCEAIAREVVQASPERTTPREENYLATSPWQMMTFEAENNYKAEIVRELFTQSHIDITRFDLVTVSGKAAQDDGFISSPGAIENPHGFFHYRNKMEYSFWGDEDGLHLALHQRGSHGKQIVRGSALAMPALDTGANAVLAELQKYSPRAGDLKTIIVRCGQKGEVVAALYTKLDDFTKMVLPTGVQGLQVYHSNPQSPASVPTRLIYELGNSTLQDTINGLPMQYDVNSFFQVNLPVYEKALARIHEYCQSDPVDMYSGVGSIGLSVAKKQVTLVELDPDTAAMARVNAEHFTDSKNTIGSQLVNVEVVEAATEKALEYIVGDKPVIFDPPRAGLHAKVVDRCLEVLPPQIIYLSCNPATQARDLALLQETYDIKFFEVYNFFPRTPHIETLAVLSKKKS